MLRLDPPALFAALDAVRTERGLAWSTVAAQSGVSAGTIQRLRRGGRFDIDGILALADWLERPVADFTRRTSR